MESLLQQHSTKDNGESPRWCAEDQYLPTLASHTGLLEETRLFLLS